MRTTPNNPVPIGASVLHLISSKPQSSSLPPEATKESLSSITKPSIPCILLSNNHPTNDDTKKQRMILVNGPSKSGKTSLAMDLAYSRACNHMCQCMDVAGCECCAVLYFRSDQNNDQSRSTVTTQRQPDDFPLGCHQLPNPESPPQDKDFATLYSELEAKSNVEKERHDSRVLRRIKVLYVSSISDILCELLAILGQQQHACQSIIIDDIDKIAACELNPSSAIMQALAVAIDTSNAFRQLSGTAPVVLATAESKFIVAPWLETINVTTVSLHQQNTGDDDNFNHRQKKSRDLNHALVPVKHFKAQVIEEWNGQTRVVSYLVAKHPGGSLRIYWMEDDSR